MKSGVRRKLERSRLGFVPQSKGDEERSATSALKKTIWTTVPSKGDEERSAT